MAKQLLYFDPDGNFVKTVRNTFGAYYVEKLTKGDTSVLFYAAEKDCNDKFCSNIILSTNEGEVINHYLSIKESLKGTSVHSGKTLYKVNDKIHYLDANTQNVYEISAEGIEKKMKIDFKSISVPDEFLKNRNWDGGGDFTRKLIKDGYATLIDNYAEKSMYIFFSFVHNNELYYYQPNKQNKENKLASFPFLHDNEKTFILGAVIGNDEELITAIDVFSLRDNDDVLSEEQKNQINLLSDNSNPVLVFYGF